MRNILRTAVINLALVVWILIIEPAIRFVKWVTLPVRLYPWQATVVAAIFAVVCISVTTMRYNAAAPEKDFWFYVGPPAFALASIKPLHWFLVGQLIDDDVLTYEEATR